VTIAAGLGEPIATGAAAWGDYDNDGRVDPFVCGEFCHHSSDAGAAEPDPRNRCRLYHNRGDGRFDDVAKVAGGVNERCARGSSLGRERGRPAIHGRDDVIGNQSPQISAGLARRHLPFSALIRDDAPGSCRR
jgi:FG-GAP-like repeat